MTDNNLELKRKNGEHTNAGDVAADNNRDEKDKPQQVNTIFHWLSQQLSKLFSKSLLHSMKTASWFVLLGICLIFFALLFEPHKSPDSPPIPDWISALWSVVEKLGDALIVVGIIDVVIHLPDWNRYFLDAIKDSIIEDSYLSRLDDGALKSLIGRALRARLKNPSISLDTKGGFLEFFFNDIHALIAKPYRENVIGEIICQEADADHFLIEDKLTYICREAGGAIQGEVKWTNDPGEIAEMIYLKIDLIPPRGKPHNLLEKNNFTPATVERIEEEIISSCRKDFLTVEVKSRYKVRRDVFQYWAMSHLTRNLTLILRYPRGYQAQLTSFGLDEELIRPDIGEEGCTIHYNSWMLPLAGICWKFNHRR